MNRIILEDRDGSKNGGFQTSRRRFLRAVANTSVLVLASPAVVAEQYNCSRKVLALVNTNTGDELKLSYFENGRYLEGALQEISYLMRDFHTGDVHPIDPALLDQLYDLKVQLGIDQSFQVFSGYRSPRTNARLHHRNRNVAKHSLHMQGRAIDIHVDGIKAHKIRNAALAMRRGGVGYSRRADFVHLDTGSFRSWLT
jgi:uncharacterized protein YcbK (DUF882 family)